MRRPRNYLPHLAAEYARQFPHRPEKKDFHDEIVVAVAFIMRQLDYRTGIQPILEPPMPAEGYAPQRNVRGKTETDE